MSKKSTRIQSPSEQPLSAQTEIEELRTGWQRTQADFENFRRHVSEERSTLRATVATETLLDLVPVYDNLCRAFSHLASDHESWASGFRAIAKQLETAFATHGLVRIPTVGQPFDPNLHEAVSEQPDPTYPAHTVCQELESGWMSNSRVLKAAKVVVSSGTNEQRKENA
ncbi:nucleotide exchange factor GrpE [Candidatus Berkelbacteria bacterium]|nr:nucleotide exchange factor GrpE [Candidatus Berkelbacteria bacterium]